jgi:F-type H+-transporting ATPase subunit a
MGEETTWFNLLPGVANLEKFAEQYLKRDKLFVDQFPSSFSITHLLSVALVVLFLAIGALVFKREVSRSDERAIVPPGRFNLRNLFEMFTDAVLNMAEGVMGEKNARRFLPLIGSLAFFIFFSNCLALIPGFAPPTATLKTNVALAVTVFLVTHIMGVKEHGIGYFKHFLGPPLVAGIPLLFPLMLPIEIISHVARPVSLSLRLLGNMAADHKVVGAFFVMVPLLVPVPFMILGVMVCIVQTLVFCILTMVYIQGAVEHEGGDEEHGHDEHAHAH